jgi:hypothetical protein
MESASRIEQLSQEVAAELRRVDYAIKGFVMHLVRALELMYLYVK